MKAHILSLLTLFGISAPAFSYEAIENDIAYLHFYGLVKARALFLDHEDNDYSFGDSKIGVEGRYAITDMISIAGGTEAQINLDADEDKDEDDLFISQYYAGIYTEPFGQLTYGKHATSSDDLNGIDYSEAFGGEANLNAVGVKGDTLKYKYANELFTINATYGFEDGDQQRTVKELFGQYNLGDMALIAGVGHTETHLANNLTDATYFQTTLRFEMGDTNFGATYYHQDFDNQSSPSRSVDKDAFAVSGQIAFVEGVTGYAGHEVVYEKEQNGSDGTLNNSYTGVSYVPVEWFKVFVEANYAKPINNRSETNFAIGAALVW